MKHLVSNFRFYLCAAFAFASTLSFAQVDTTPDSWVESGSFLTTGSFAGRVGIGTAAPVRRFQVNSTGGVISLFENNNANGALVDIYSGLSKDAAIRFQGGSNWTVGNDNSLGNAFAVTLFNGFPSGAPDANKFMVVRTSGRVGFGTTNPQDRFEIKHSTHPAMRVGDNTGQLAQLAVATSPGFYSQFAEGGDIVMRSLGGGGVIVASHGVGKSIRFATQGAAAGPVNHKVRLAINSDGSIGMGVTAVPSGYRLAVDGKVICEELRVRNSTLWPDYVFADNYELRSLDEVASFIEANHHLPNFPAASTVEAEGYEVGDMQTRLVKTVEELTLYMLDLKAENEALRTRIEALEEE